ncbi:dysbindin protein homolog [Drosophila mojavensis]|uniref:Dysbindin protein homolog n=1 Tax=Drosophila mojavensis TaxID=7230 RepID=B4KXR8_DROMO|nr:dysbindin protein homolog [Drosophila mojavensis]EDW19775.1 uncharacterized protein Dmoj_GI11321 [Drosophila mojavensis]
MLGSLKKKISNAIQEGIVISESLHEQYRQRVGGSTSSRTSEATAPKATGLDSSHLSLNGSHFSNGSSVYLSDVPTKLNVAAGCNLLSKYEDSWQQIHAANERNAENAETLAFQITAVLRSANEKRATINELNSCLSALPALVVKLEECTEVIGSLEKLGLELEQELDKLENLCEECELQEFVLAQQFQLSKHKQKKLIELEQYRQKIADQHQQTIQTHEQHLRRLQKERQAVFHDAFCEDLEEYKQSGQLPKIETKAMKLCLEDVVLEEKDFATSDALEHFLND